MGKGRFVVPLCVIWYMVARLYHEENELITPTKITMHTPNVNQTYSFHGE